MMDGSLSCRWWHARGRGIAGVTRQSATRWRIARWRRPCGVAIVWWRTRVGLRRWHVIAAILRTRLAILRARLDVLCIVLAVLRVRVGVPVTCGTCSARVDRPVPVVHGRCARLAIVRARLRRSGWRAHASPLRVGLLLAAFRLELEHFCTHELGASRALCVRPTGNCDQPHVDAERYLASTLHRDVRPGLL